MNALRMPVSALVGDGVMLRTFQDCDADMLCDLATDPYLSLIGSLPANADRTEALAFIARQHERMPTGVGYSFCVTDPADQAVGTAGLWLADLSQGRATVGYSIAPRFRGRGFARSALRTLTEFAWTLPELFRIEAYIEPWNAGSVRTAEACGYVREGLLRSHQPIGDRRADMLLYANLRPDLSLPQSSGHTTRTEALPPNTSG